MRDDTPHARSRQISDLYQRALAVPESERDVFLNRECREDEALRLEVESLLRFEADADSFLERPAFDAADMVGRTLGPYAVTARIGGGGMGEVYRARDSQLGRDVAIKILPVHFTDDPERRARFAREARVLATLNHPHIGAIYGLEQVDGVSALVLELVEGQALSERLARGPLPLDDVRIIARQSAEALAAAHDKGVVHRDFKPGNIVLRRDPGVAAGGVFVKVLDFGLAKPIVAGADANLSDGLNRVSDRGRMFGTPAYMSPEQARGLAVDTRTDVWAFGCVLFEMLSGSPAFDGDTVTDTLARILEREPDWTALPPDTPASIRRLVKRCLRKDPGRRLHDIRDVVIDLEELDDDGSSPDHPDAARMAGRSRRKTFIRWAAACLVGIGLGVAAVAWRRPFNIAPSPESQLFPIEPAPGLRAVGPRLRFALAPDGRHLAFIVRGEGAPLLAVRNLASGQVRQFAGTDGALMPFWAPDSRHIAFFTETKLKRVPVDGGVPFEVSDLGLGSSAGVDERISGIGTADRTTFFWMGAGSLQRLAASGGAWGPDGTIVFWSPAGYLQKVPASGGTPRPATELGEGELAHEWPSFLPDGQHFLFLEYGSAQRHLRVGSLGSRASRSLGSIPSAAVYAAGHILFADGGLVSQPFDARSFERSDDLRTVTSSVVTQGTRGAFSVSEAGLLAYWDSPLQYAQLTWVDRRGNVIATIGRPQHESNMRLNADDTRLVISRQTARSVGADLWILNLTRDGEESIFTTDPASESDPSWSRDGKAIVLASDRRGQFDLYRRLVAPATGSDELIAEVPGVGLVGADWSADGKVVIAAGSDGDLWVRRFSGTPALSAFHKTPDEREAEPAFSPDGRWVAYVSAKTGRSEVYVRSFPGADHEERISRDGGMYPRWRSAGELFFVGLDEVMMSARVTTTGGFYHDTPQRLFKTSMPNFGQNNHPYDVSRDGRRFVISIPTEPARFIVTLMTNWPARLQREAGEGR